MVETKQGAGAGTGNGDSKEPMNHRSYFQKPMEMTVYLFSIDFGKRGNIFFFFFFLLELHQNSGVRKCRLAMIDLSSENGNYEIDIIFWANVFPGLATLEWDGY